MKRSSPIENNETSVQNKARGCFYSAPMLTLITPSESLNLVKETKDRHFCRTLAGAIEMRQVLRVPKMKEVEKRSLSRSILSLVHDAPCQTFVDIHENKILNNPVVATRSFSGFYLVEFLVHAKLFSHIFTRST